MGITTTPNMALSLSTPATVGPYTPSVASLVQADFAIIDAHNHLQSGGPGAGGTNGTAIGAVSAIQTVNLTAAPTAPVYTLLMSTAAAKTVTLPASNASSKGYRLTVKDATGTAGANNITITPAGTDKIDTVAASKTIAANFGSLSLVSDGAGNWYVV